MTPGDSLAVIDGERRNELVETFNQLTDREHPIREYRDGIRYLQDGTRIQYIRPANRYTRRAENQLGILQIDTSDQAPEGLRNFRLSLRSRRMAEVGMEDTASTIEWRHGHPLPIDYFDPKPIAEELVDYVQHEMNRYAALEQALEAQGYRTGRRIPKSMTTETLRPAD